MISSSLFEGETATAFARVAMGADASGTSASAVGAMQLSDDFQRDVYGVLGSPIDVIDMETALEKIHSAAVDRSTFWISTINLNYLITARADPDFRESLLLSDLCTADGMPVVWIARLLGVPIKSRVAGSDMLNALRSNAAGLRIFLFGGEEGVAATACRNINFEHKGLVCAGTHYPGFGAVEEMSNTDVMAAINASGADIIAVALGAKKGQAWLLQNHCRLRVPIRAHLGAALNFEAGTIRRAPLRVRQIGLEWAWRIWQEPQLWRRYANDGLALVRLFTTRILPLLVVGKWLKSRDKNACFHIERTDDNGSIVLHPHGPADAKHITTAIVAFRAAATENKPIVINFAGAQHIDARFLGLVLMLDKHLKGRGLGLSFSVVPPMIRRFIRLNGFGFLFNSGVEKA
jgi:N-acetylglucosaminyldiphosphoundecaprenol N-acetyl-beta-D-mannosaminyltransferase